MEIRPAARDEAVPICALLRRSIESLCVADHEGHPSILDRWLRNKTPDIVGSWLENPELHVLVAIRDRRIAGVGAAAQAGEITLNYVSPDFRFQGISRAILESLERALLDAGNTVAMLTSTATAHRFYLSAGYGDDGPPKHWCGDSLGYPMRKILIPNR